MGTGIIIEPQSSSKFAKALPPLIKQFPSQHATQLKQQEQNLQRATGGLSQMSGSSSGQLREQFQIRFKGRTHLINKEGHIGVAKNTTIPIMKSVNQPGDMTKSTPMKAPQSAISDFQNLAESAVSNNPQQLQITQIHHHHHHHHHHSPAQSPDLINYDLAPIPKTVGPLGLSPEQKAYDSPMVMGGRSRRGVVGEDGATIQQHNRINTRFSSIKKGPQIAATNQGDGGLQLPYYPLTEQKPKNILTSEDSGIEPRNLARIGSQVRMGQDNISISHNESIASLKQDTGNHGYIRSKTTLMLGEQQQSLPQVDTKPLMVNSRNSAHRVGLRKRQMTQFLNQINRINNQPQNEESSLGHLQLKTGRSVHLRAPSHQILMQNSNTQSIPIFLGSGAILEDDGSTTLYQNDYYQERIPMQIPRSALPGSQISMMPSIQTRIPIHPSFMQAPAYQDKPYAYSPILPQYNLLQPILQNNTQFFNQRGHHLRSSLSYLGPPPQPSSNLQPSYLGYSIPLTTNPYPAKQNFDQRSNDIPRSATGFLMPQYNNPRLPQLSKYHEFLNHSLLVQATQGGNSHLYNSFDGAVQNQYLGIPINQTGLILNEMAHPTGVNEYQNQSVDYGEVKRRRKNSVQIVASQKHAIGGQQVKQGERGLERQSSLRMPEEQGKVRNLRQRKEAILSQRDIQE
ncbi:hypothetical protein FGO68_gene11792 [Halteria grandinella]|uniref:Uncharacterized protein n=1 Tax=Halteria grandinella TaxID=5974 RepID=A0A8J8NYE6_HALGN|nr:hypothetical protein FGO68_gene11792 [Halteria grandinella]